MEGSVKLSRRILNSQVFAHATALKIWIWCLCKATYKQRYIPLKIGKGEITVKLEPGQFVFGRFKAEDELNIDGSTIYKWMQKFSNSEFDMIKIESNNQYSIITICNWEEYQIKEGRRITTKEQPKDNQVTAEGQPSNTNNKVNKVNNIYGEFYNTEIEKSGQNENYIKVIKGLYGENNLCIPLGAVLKMEHQLSFEQFKKLWYLKEKYNFSIVQILEKMEDWGNPKKRKTVYGTFLTFAKNENKDIVLK